MSTLPTIPAVQRALARQVARANDENAQDVAYPDARYCPIVRRLQSLEDVLDLLARQTARGNRWPMGEDASDTMEVLRSIAVSLVGRLAGDGVTL